jgi:hypothetical protein
MNLDIAKYKENLSAKNWQYNIYRKEFQEHISKTVFDKDRNSYIRMDDYNFDCTDSTLQQAFFVAQKIELINTQQRESFRVENIPPATEKYLLEKSMNLLVNEELKFYRNESWKLNGTLDLFKGKIESHKKAAGMLNLFRFVNQ